jgi:hypothetical protein
MLKTSFCLITVEMQIRMLCDCLAYFHEEEVNPMRQIHYLSAALFLFAITSWLPSGQAATIYVDKDNSCPGSGTSGNPYCSIQSAFKSASPGDSVLIRDGASAYNETATLTTSGTSSHPIVITKDTGHNPNITYAAAGAQTGAIVLKDVSNVTISGLRFDGAGLQTSRNAINIINSRGAPMTGINIIDITCNHWGGTAIATQQAACIRTAANARASTISVSVRNSMFTGNRFSSLRLSYSKNAVVEGNTITDQKCGLTNQGSLHWAGIKIGGGSAGMTIRNNRIYSFQSYVDCINNVSPTNTKAMIMAGIYCDTGGNNGTIEKNEIHRLNYPNIFPVGDSVGIFLESRCSGWTVKNNIVHKIGHKGIRNGSSSTGDPNNNTYVNNTLVNIGTHGIWIRRGANQTIKNNIVHVDSSGIPIEFNATALSQGGHQIDHNLYWDSQDGSRVGRWGDKLTHNLAGWRHSCQCDGATLSVNPSFMSISDGSEDFRLTSSSPARGAGEREIDLGASLSPSK